MTDWEYPDELAPGTEDVEIVEDLPPDGKDHKDLPRTGPE